MTDLKRTFPHQLPILNWSLEPHYRSGYNKKTLERDVLNDQRLCGENGRKMAHLLSSTFRVPKWIYLYIYLFYLFIYLAFKVCRRCSGAGRTLEGRVGAGKTRGRRSGEQTLWQWDKEACSQCLIPLRASGTSAHMWAGQEEVSRDSVSPYFCAQGFFLLRLRQSRSDQKKNNKKRNPANSEPVWASQPRQMSHVT